MAYSSFANKARSVSSFRKASTNIRSVDEVGFRPSYLPLPHLMSCGHCERNPQLKTLTMIRFMFLVLERHRVVAPLSIPPLAALVPAL